MDGNIIIGLLSLAGTALGSLAGIMTSSKLTNHRLKELEKKVERHNTFDSRLVEVEQKTKSAFKSIDEIKAGLRAQKRQG